MQILSTHLKKAKESEKIRYLIVGTIAYFTDISISILLVSGWDFDPIAASIFSFLISTISSYILTINYVFIKSTRKKRLTLPLYLVSTGIGIVITKFVLEALTNQLEIHYLISKNIAVAFIIVANYFIRKYLIFKK